MKKIMVVGIGFCLFFTGFCFAWCPPGDLNNDCRINLEDLSILAAHWFVEGENAVPDVIGMTQSAAETAIRDAYLAVGTVTEEYSDLYAAGLVMAQDPNAGILLGLDEPVNLVVSIVLLGPEITWVAINDPGVPGHEAFNGEMSKYETTNAQYCQYLNSAMASGYITVSGYYVVGASGPYSGQNYYQMNGPGINWEGATNGGASRIHWTGGEFTVDSGFEDHPVTYVSWYGATAFANYYGWRLPTEWEWQAVADYDGSYTYGCGTTINNSILNYFNSPHPDGTTVVGAFGTYGYGMADMAGNASEWSDSCYYANCAPNVLVFRGGSWGSIESSCLVSCREYQYPGVMNSNIGFRVCR